MLKFLFFNIHIYNLFIYQSIYLYLLIALVYKFNLNPIFYKFKIQVKIIFTIFRRKRLKTITQNLIKNELTSLILPAVGKIHSIQYIKYIILKNLFFLILLCLIRCIDFLFYIFIYIIN